MKTVFIAALLLILYGYVCRMAGICFFWESSYIGWLLLLIALIGILLQRIKMKKMIRKKMIVEKIAIGFIIFTLFVKILLLVIIPFTDAYTAVKQQLLNDHTIQAEIGTIHGFSIVPTGGIHQSTQNGKVNGSASITLILKGEKKFKEAIVFVTKYEDQQEWVVERVE